MIKKVKLLSDDFKGQRSAYSSSSFFIAILANHVDEYDHEAIGEAILPDGFGCIEPPGPNSGFGEIRLMDQEEDGKVDLSTLTKRVKKSALNKSLEEYFDGFFVLSKKAKALEQVDFAAFRAFMDSKEFNQIHFVEFEPD